MISGKRVQAGFTLIELLVVISIIGMLVAVAAVSFTSTQQRSRNSRRIQDMETLQKAMEMYASVGVTGITASGKGQYPTSVTATNLGMPSLPTDPQGSSYSYNATTVSSYCFCALLEGTTNTGGNFGTSACGTPSGASHYCVQNQQ